jgi:hypothetical protein
MIELLQHQKEFIEAKETEVILLGDKDTGKSFAQYYDAVEYALAHPQTWQLFISDEPRRSVDLLSSYIGKLKVDLERRDFWFIIHFGNGSKILICPRIRNIDDAYRHCGAEYQVIRIDTEIFNVDSYAYEFLLSRLRSNMKITARDGSYRLMTGRKMRVIEAKCDTSSIDAIFKEVGKACKEHINKICPEFQETYDEITKTFTNNG